jgi:integrase
LVAAGTTERWRTALGLAGYAGLRLGEVRALTWADIDFEAGTLSVRRSLLPDGTAKEPKTEAGIRTVPMLPALRRLLLTWKLRSPYTQPGALVVATADGKAVSERNLRRALEAAKDAAELTAGRTASPGTRSGTRSPHSWRPTSNCPRRRSRASPAIRTPASRCVSMPATAGTKPRSLATFSPERQALGWDRESGFSQVRASDAGGVGRKNLAPARGFMRP